MFLPADAHVAGFVEAEEVHCPRLRRFFFPFDFLMPRRATSPFSLTSSPLCRLAPFFFASVFSRADPDRGHASEGRSTYRFFRIFPLPNLPYTGEAGGVTSIVDHSIFPLPPPLLADLVQKRCFLRFFPLCSSPWTLVEKTRTFSSDP